MAQLFIGNQKTIREKVKLSGLTIDGDKTQVALFPYDQGIVFKKKGTEYNINPEVVRVKKKRVFIGNIGMIEHLLSVLAGLGIDNMLIEIHGDELPIFDGSAREYYDAISAVVIQDLQKPRKFFKFETLQVRQENSFIVSDFSNETKIEVEYDPYHPMVKKTKFRFSSLSDIVDARTFAFIDQDDFRIKNYRFGLGITDNDFYPQPHYDDEPLRHKVIDLIGDLYTVGIPFSGKIRAKNPGHKINISFVKRQLTQIPPKL